MNNLFDEQKWLEAIKKSDWYFIIVPEIETIRKQLEERGDKNESESVKEQIYGFFEKQLALDNIALGHTGKNQDAARMPIDTVVIHHTANPPGLTPARLSAMELARLYAPYYAAPTYEADSDFKGQPIYSGHFRNSKQIFWPYHWIIRQDGNAERLLLDNEIGWHAGNWDTNCRSVAIVFDNNYADSAPSAIELQAVADIIKTNYGDVPKKNIIGHCEVKPMTVCPSKIFLDHDGQTGWKHDLLALI